MQLIYFHTYGGEMYNGVNKKIFAQSSQLYKLGIDFSLVLLGGVNTNYPDYKFIHYLSLKDTWFLKIKIFKKFFRQYLAKQYIKKIIQFSGSGTILYLRYPLPLFLFPHELHIPRNCKIIVECNSIEMNEDSKSRSYFSYYKELLLGKDYLKRCDGIVGVTDEITHYHVKVSGDLNKPHITIGNGFEVDSVPVRQPPLNCSPDFNIVCVADVSIWHGIDRLIQGIAHYKGPLKIQLHIVGNGAELQNLRKLSSNLALNDQIIFHGFVNHDNLDILFDQCHLAVGSLGIHRIGLSQVSILKAREYCARGIPYIIACSDPDFPEDFPYILRFPSDESPIDMDQVVTFASSICQDAGHPRLMRLYASENLDWSVKMKKLKVFLEDLVKEDYSNRY